MTDIVEESIFTEKEPVKPWAPDPNLWTPAIGVMGLTADRNALRLAYIAEGISNVTGRDKAKILSELMEPKTVDRHTSRMSMTLGALAVDRRADLNMPIGFAREVYFYDHRAITIASDQRDGIGPHLNQQGLIVKVELPMIGETSFYHLPFHSKPNPEGI